MRSVIKSWTNNLCKREVYVDKCRGWETDYDLLFKLIPNAKVIYVMRDLRGVISSFEKVENYKRILPTNDSLIPDKDEFNDVDIMEYRVENYLNDDMISTPLYALKELVENYILIILNLLDMKITWKNQKKFLLTSIIL